MQRVPEARKVSKALSAADKAIKNCLRAVNQDAAKLMSRGEYSRAQELASVGTQVQSFRRELDVLREKWNAVGGSAEGKTTKDSITPLWAYYQPILQALVNAGGEARRSEIEPEVEQLMKGRLKDGDHDISRGRARWQSMIRKAHRHLIKEGWLEPQAGKVWKITAAGRQAAKAEISTASQKQTVS